jgi:uncharacterized protein (DUF1800 family)
MGSLVGCGGGTDAATPNAGHVERSTAAGVEGTDGEGAQAFVATQLDAVRLAHQATFGPSEPLVKDIRQKGPKAWVVGQMALSVSRYKLGGDNSPDKNASKTEFCLLPDHVKDPYCWRDYLSSQPLLWDFYRNAVRNEDQLRQRVALALNQLLVISNVDVDGTYGLRSYFNNMMKGAFGNYRDLLKQVVVSPMMGEYLDHVNNDQAAPNENFARELLQLFTIGSCKLNTDGTLVDGRCRATYDNERVRSYAYALTGWTYPPGGADRWGCHPEGANCKYRYGDMVPAGGALRDTKQRKLLSDVIVPAGTSAPKALEKVLDSLMSHPNIAPFVGKHLIQQLVTSNPTPEYVTRVAKAFNTGRHDDIGTGKKGDLSAVVAAVLLDKEARTEQPGDKAGRLREPIQLFTGVIRAIGGDTDGDALAGWQGGNLSQIVFRSPTVFNYYPQDYPLTGSKLDAPPFGIHNASTALNRLTYLTTLFDRDGADPQKDVPGAVGTKLTYDAWVSDAPDAAKLVDRISNLVLGMPLPRPARTKVIEAVEHFDDKNSPGDWRKRRVQRAGWLVMSSPEYQIIR